nr:uncharacterized protein LOC129271609 [Lytechinus pictus]
MKLSNLHIITILLDHHQIPKSFKMAKVFFLVLVATLVVAALAIDFEEDFEDDATDVEFLKRDPEMQEYFMAEKRGRTLKKYKFCPRPSGQPCWCSRRSKKLVFCNGAGTGDAI